VLAVGLALCSAALFGSMSVALRFSLRRCPDAEAGALASALIALVPCALIAIAGSQWRGNVVPFLLAGLLAPGCTQLLHVLAVRDAGPARASVVVGVAPLFAGTIAIAAFGEPLRAGLIGGAVLIVLGGVALAGERVRPETFRGIGVAFALAGTLFFSIRDNVVRHYAMHTRVPPQLAASMAILSGVALMAVYLLVTRGPQAMRETVPKALVPFALPGLLWGTSYAALFEAFYRGRVTVVNPLVATESLFGVLIASILLRRSELVSRHLWLGAALVVAGGALIGAFR
jgi:drug/metabolite transporter (DMT)-like permease